MADTVAEKGSNAGSEVIERMFGAGAHFGYSRSKRHPSASPYLYGVKNRVEIFDLEKTQAKLEAAKAFATELGLEGKVLLFVGGKAEARNAIRQAAEGLGLPYVAGRWIGGTLTNFPEIRKRIELLESLRDQREKGELAKYTKRERLMIDREITRLEESFGGLVPMHERIPDALFVVDTKREHIAVSEAHKSNLPVIGLTNSDCDLSKTDFPIPANDSTAKSITFFVDQIAEAYRAGVKNAPAKKTEAPKQEVAPAAS